MSAEKRKDIEYNASTLIEKLTFWCRQQPVGCTRTSNKCFNLRSCHESTPCLSFSLAATENIFTDLVSECGADNNKKMPKEKTIKNFVADYRKGTRPAILTNKLKVLLEYLIEYEENPCKDNQKFNKYKSNLEILYKEWKISEALEEVEAAIYDYPYHPVIIRWWALLHNRKMKWHKLREVLKKKRKHINPDVVVESNLGLFESYLNELTPKIYEPNIFQELQLAKNEYLEPINSIKEDGQYYYFKGRYLEEEWLIYTNETKLINTNILREALMNINKSIEIYEDSRSDKEKKNESSVPYWLYCHRCILFKLLSDNDFHIPLVEYKNIIDKRFEDEFEKRPVQIYMITYFLLKESDKDELERFLLELDEKVNSANKKTNTVLENFTFHHVDLLFHDKPIRAEYLKVLNEWANKNQKS
jgi:hypothetical protein